MRPPHSRVLRCSARAVSAAFVFFARRACVRTSLRRGKEPRTKYDLYTLRVRVSPRVLCWFGSEGWRVDCRRCTPQAYSNKSKGQDSCAGRPMGWLGGRAVIRRGVRLPQPLPPRVARARGRARAGPCGHLLRRVPWLRLGLRCGFGAAKLEAHTGAAVGPAVLAPVAVSARKLASAGSRRLSLYNVKRG